MKKSLLKTKLYLLAVALITVSQSCTDLTETPYSDVTPENFFNTEEEFVSALGEAYTRLDWWRDHNRMLTLQEVTSDEMVVPTRGQDWDDGGTYRRMHTHEWDFEDPRINWTWTYLYGGISTFNRLIYQFESLEADNADKFIAELRGLRALFYWQLLDLFGNVPIVTEFDVPDDFAPVTNARQEVFDFVEQELLEIEDLLTKEVGGTAYGRFNYYTAKALLAKIYLNAEVYTGTSQWQKAVEACDAIISSQEFSLAADYYDNFITDNQNSPEFIFAIPYDRVYFPDFNYHRITLHYASQATYDLTVQPWNGFSATEGYYESYIDPVQNPGPQGEVWGTEPTSSAEVGLERVQGTLDKRLDNFIVGPQHSSSGERLMDESAEARDPNGRPLTFTPHIHGLATAIRQDGARIGKWEFAPGTGASLDNDFAIFRYAGILLMKAEALFWQGQTGGEALNLVNQIRARAGVDDFTSLTAENLLAERGRELFAELHRRTDLIRFGKFTEGWEFNDPDPSDHIKLFPVPRPQLDANPNLEQNPGY